LTACQGAQDFLRRLADDVAQLLARQGGIAICQEYPKNRVNQRQVPADIVRLFATVSLQHVLQAVHLRHFTRFRVYPVDFLRVKVFAKDCLVFFAQVNSQFYADV
jgi:hypothetical protein